MKILIQGAGIGGCAIAASLSQQGHSVTVVEKRKELFTDGAGIVLYSNALKCLDYIGVLSEVLEEGFSMEGNTELWDSKSTFVGYVKYSTIDKMYPSYVGINRRKFLKILYNKAVKNQAKFYFGVSTVEATVTGEHSRPIKLTNGHEELYDLVIAADGTNSSIRRTLFDNQESVFTKYGLWHSLHKRRPEINEKITVFGEGCRLGFVPLSKDSMYIWASAPEDVKIKIPHEMQPKLMKEKFSSAFTGLVKDVVDEINEFTYVNFTAVEEVHLPKPWYKGNVVFIGDSAHASLPFMAQGGAQALQDVATLTQLLSKGHDLRSTLTEYTNFRFDIAKLVQSTSNKIGQGYKVDAGIDVKKAQEGADAFYRNLTNFKLPFDL